MILFMLASPLGWAAHTLIAYWVGTTKWVGGRLPVESRGRLFVAFAFAGTPRVLFVLGGIVLIYGPLLILLTLVSVGVTTAFASKHMMELDDASATTVAMASCLALFAVSVVVPTVLAAAII